VRAGQRIRHGQSSILCVADPKRVLQVRDPAADFHPREQFFGGRPLHDVVVHACVKSAQDVGRSVAN
jgi:hypothetical protein